MFCNPVLTLDMYIVKIQPKNMCVNIIIILSTGDLGVVQVYPMLGESRVIGPELRAACLNLGPMSSGAL